MMRRAIVLLAALLVSSGCLVLSLNPAYDDASLVWEPGLIGSWVDAEDHASLDIERSDWNSYRIKYVHPIETGTLTGYVTSVGDDRFLDLMPVRGEDRGAFLVPVHAVLRMHLDGDTLQLTGLSYDWFSQRARNGAGIPGLRLSKDQKENALISSPTSQVRAWLRAQPGNGAMFGASVVFTRKR